MAIYFKFKSAKDYDSIPIDGHFISIGNLKEKIFESKHLGRGTDFDLLVSNPNTEEEYLDEAMLLPKNTSVLVRRVPGKPRMPIVTDRDERKETEHHADPVSAHLPGPSQSNFPEESEWDEFGNDLYAIPQAPPQVQFTNVVESIPSRIEEESKIKAHIDMTDLDWQRQLQESSSSGRGFRRGIGGRMMPGRGFGRGGMESKTPPPGYICHRCKVPGHFIQHCPTNGDPNYDIKKVKPPTGIPKSMLMATPDGSYALPSGAVAVLKPNEAAFEKEIEGLPSTRSVSDLPAELRCPLCKEVLKDAVFVSKCCYESFCDKCIREYIVKQSKCVCGATNVLTDDLLPNKRLRETINCILETKATSSAENGGNLLQIQDMESARCPPPKVPSPSLSGTVKEEKAQTSSRGSIQVLKEAVREILETANAPQQSNEKSKAAKSVDQVEVTHQSMSTKDPVSHDSGPQAEDEVQQKLPAVDLGKKKTKKKRLRPPVNTMDMQWRTPQDFGSEGSMMPVAPAAYNTYWPGMQLGLEGYVPGYGAGLPYTGYPNPYDLSFGMLRPDLFAASGFMLPSVPPPSLFPEYGMGPNPTPPLMTREEFEARKADLRRRQEQRIERESSRDKGRSIREVNADADAHQPTKRPRLMSQTGSMDRLERQTSPVRIRDADSVRLSPRASKQRKQEYEDYAVGDAKLADRKHKASVFSRISFPESGDDGKKRKAQEPMDGSKEKDDVRSRHEDREKQSSRRSNRESDGRDDDDLHFKRRRSSSRYKDDKQEWEEGRSRELDHGRGHDRRHDSTRSSTRHK